MHDGFSCDFHIDIFSFLLGFYDEISRLKHCCSLLKERCHIMPLRRPKIRDALLKLLQIILTQELPRHMKLHKWSKESSSAVKRAT